MTSDATLQEPVNARIVVRRRPRRLNRILRRGASATEFAIIAPVFFLMIVGFIEFGRALMVQQVLVNASRVGAREAITAGATSTSVTNTVKSYASGISVPDVNVAISPSPATAATGQLITVTVNIGFDQISWLPVPHFLAGKTLTASSTMRKEGLN